MSTETSAATPPVDGGEPTSRRSLSGYLRSLEVDPRMFGMIAALLIIWVIFDLWSGHLFLTPRNLWNLTVQTASVGIMATGMVLVIVSRNIDLSVGSMVATIGMAMALLQVEWLPDWLGLGHPLTWLITLLAGMALGGLIGAFQGAIVAYAGVPAFIVTLGGLLVWRGVAWRMAGGRTISPMDGNFALLGGGSKGTIGGTWTWVIAGLACVGIVLLLVNGRRRRQKFGFALRPLWADLALAVVGCGAVVGAAAVINAYPMPPLLARRYADEHGIEFVQGMKISLGLANPVLILILVGLVMTFVATRLRFGRYVYAIGGNPEAAELGGIKTRWTTVRVFILMGVLAAISAAVLTARLDAATSGLGVNMELYVIAATVIGGTSLSGGSGTIPGAILGALVAQSLQSGMVLIGFDAPTQNIVIGVVLVVAVALDSLFRRRVAA